MSKKDKDNIYRWIYLIGLLYFMLFISQLSISEDIQWFTAMAWGAIGVILRQMSILKSGEFGMGFEIGLLVIPILGMGVGWIVYSILSIIGSSLAVLIPETAIILLASSFTYQLLSERSFVYKTYGIKGKIILSQLRRKFTHSSSISKGNEKDALLEDKRDVLEYKQFNSIVPYVALLFLIIFMIYFVVVPPQMYNSFILLIQVGLLNLVMGWILRIIYQYSK